MLAHSEVVDRFFEGKRSGKGARMGIVAINEDTTVLEGYGWAAYAMNHKGRIYKFGDWIGFSSTTTCHMGMIGPVSDLDYIVYRKPSTLEASKFIDVPEDSEDRLREHIFSTNDRFEFPEFDLVIGPGSKHLVASVNDGLGNTEIPALDKAIDVIFNHDEEGLEFIKRLAQSRLNPKNHMHFNLSRLEEAIVISERVKEAINKYEDILKRKGIGKEFTPITVDGCMLFVKKEGGDIRVLAVYNTLYDIACFSGSVPKVVLGKALYNKKIHKTMKDKIFKDKKQITPSEFGDEIAKHGLSDTIKGLPNWISTKVIAHQLGVA